MDCDETRGALEEYRRGAVSAEVASRIETHLAECPVCRRLREADDTLAAMIGRLPRTMAPSSLRREIQALAGARRGPADWLARPWVAAALAAVLVAALLAPWVPWRGESSPDPVDELIEAGLDQYKGIVLQLKGFGGEVGDPAAAFAIVRSLTNIQLPAAWAQDKEFRLVAARPVVIANRRAAVAVLARDADSVTACFLVRGTDLPMPAERRVHIGQYTPYSREADGLRAIYWKQGDLAYLIVTGLDDTERRELFLRMREAL